MKSVAQVRDDAVVRFEKNFATWAQSHTTEPESRAWSLSIPLGAPDERDALVDFDATSRWARSWLEFAGPGEVTTVQRSWRSLASQRIPTHLSFATPEEVAGFVRRATEWTRAHTRLRDLATDWGRLRQLDRRTFTQVVSLDPGDWARTRAFLVWVDAHPTSGLLPRQLPIPGIDSKWYEGHRPLCVALRRATVEDESLADGFGLRDLDRPVVIRVLDRRLRAQFGGLGDFSAPPSELAALNWQPSTVIVCENLQCAYSFGDLPGTVLIAKQGYAVDVLGRLPWLSGARILYWGDIDTHGFAILNRFRAHFPRAESILMDEMTLRANEVLWGAEGKQSSQSPSLLTSEERHVFDGLRSGRYGGNIRLEQERIPWADVEAAVDEKLAAPGAQS